GLAAEHGGEEVVGAERAERPADHRLAPLLHAPGNVSAAVDGHVEEEAGLPLRVELLDQRHSSGERGRAAVTGALHRVAPHRLGGHVVPDGAPVAPVERLQPDDGGTLLAARIGPDADAGESARLQLALDHAGLAAAKAAGVAE